MSDPIVIPGWSTFQAYKQRTPPWIRLYRDLLVKPEWNALTGDAAKLLMELWLVASESKQKDGTISTPTSDLAWRLRRPLDMLVRLLLELERHGFVETAIADVDTVLATCMQPADNMLPQSSTEQYRAETEQRERQTRERTAPSSSSFEKLVAYVGEANRELVAAVAQMPGCGPAWAAGVLANFGPGELLDLTANRVPEADRPRVLALAFSRFASDAKDWSIPLFRKFVERAWTDRTKSEQQDADVARGVARSAGLRPVIEERRATKPNDALTTDSEDVDGMVNQLASKMTRIPRA